MLTQLEIFRINLHQIPELGFEEFETKTYLYNQIKDLNCTVHEVGDTGLLLYFDFGQKKTLAFRADMDALPIEEKTNLHFQSKNIGNMHACGHDGHMAILLGLAHYLHAQESLTKNVVLIFQPSEEKEAGAHTIVDSKLLEHYQVQSIFGLHLWPGLAKGEVYSRQGEFMAQGSEVDVIVHGRAAHVASSEQGVDALQIACRLLTDLYDEEKKLPSDVYRLLKFGEMHSGFVRNILSDKTIVRGSVRSFDPMIHQKLKALIAETALRYETDYTCQIDVHYNDGYDVVYNHPKLFQQVIKTIPYLHQLEKPVMQSEDFGLYGKTIPAVFFFLGIGDTPPLHNEKFDFDMSVLDKGLQLFLDLLTL